MDNIDTYIQYVFSLRRRKGYFVWKLWPLYYDIIVHNIYTNTNSTFIFKKYFALCAPNHIHDCCGKGMYIIIGMCAVKCFSFMGIVVGGWGCKRSKMTTLAGLEPTRNYSNRFLVDRLNHSATVSNTLLHLRTYPRWGSNPRPWVY